MATVLQLIYASPSASLAYLTEGLGTLVKELQHELEFFDVAPGGNVLALLRKKDQDGQQKMLLWRALHDTYMKYKC